MAQAVYSREVCWTEPISDRNSRRVDGSSRKAPVILLVTIEVPGLWTPRVVMQ